MAASQCTAAWWFVSSFCIAVPSQVSTLAYLSPVRFWVGERFLLRPPELARRSSVALHRGLVCCLFVCLQGGQSALHKAANDITTTAVSVGRILAPVADDPTALEGLVLQKTARCQLPGSW